MLWKFALLSTVLLVAGVGNAATPRKISIASKATTRAAATQIIQNCDAHKFETLVTAVVDGKPEQKRIKLCGVDGQSDAAWIGTLNDAIKKLEADQQIAPAVRAQIVTAIKSEVARLKIAALLPPPRSRGTEAGMVSVSPRLSNDYPALPPIPQATGVPRATVQTEPASPSASAEMPANSVRKDFADLPPLSAGPTMPAASQDIPAAARVDLAAPRLKFACDTPGDFAGDLPCALFERETVLIVHAADDVPGGTRLEFVRNNELRADVPLDGLRRGKSLRLALPEKVCRGFTSGKLELRVVHGEGGGGGQQLSTDGPYNLNC